MRIHWVEVDHVPAALAVEQVAGITGQQQAAQASIEDAVARLKAKLDAWRARETAAGRTPSDRGSIEIVDGLDEEALRQLAMLRFHVGLLKTLLACAALGLAIKLGGL